MMTTYDSDALSALADLGSATVYEANGQRDALDPALKPLDPATKMAGRAVTVSLAPADNWFIHIGLLEAGPGDVLVVDVQGYVDAGPWGDVLTHAAQARGLAGLVIDGAVRDSQQVIAAGFPCFARGVCIRGTSKVQQGSINVPVTVGGVLVNPGDILIGDADGLVRVRPGDAETALAASRAREEKEARFMQEIDNGRSTLELMGLTDPR